MAATRHDAARSCAQRVRTRHFLLSAQRLHVWGHKPELVRARLLAEGGNGPIEQFAVDVARPQPLSVLHVFLHLYVCGYDRFRWKCHTLQKIIFPLSVATGRKKAISTPFSLEFQADSCRKD